MPRVEYKSPSFPTAFGEPDKAPEEPPSWSQIFDAAFGLESDVVNTYDLLTRPKFAQNPDYPLTQKLKDTPFWDEYRENFIGTQSDEELQWRMNKIREEERRREVLARAGWAGTTTMVAAGMLSPTIFIPFAGPAARGWKLVGQAAALGGLGAGLQEATLLANQETRTADETAFSMAASTVLSGLLGSAVAQLRKGDWERLVEDMANSRHETAIPNAVPAAGGAAATRAPGAGQMDPGPGGLAKGLAKVVDSNPVTRSPVIDNLNSDWASAQYAMAQFSDAGVSMVGNRWGVPTTPGGTVENRVASWYGNFWKSTSALDDNYNKYYFDDSVPTILPGYRAAAGGYIGAGGKISRSQFNREVAEAFHNGDVHPNPEVPYSAAASAAAQAIRKELYDPLLKAAQESKVFSQLDELGEQEDKSYLNWLFNHALINARPNEFVDFLQKEFNNIYQAEFAKRLEKFRVKEQESRELVEDIQTPEDQIEVMRDIYGDELRTVEEGAETQHVTALEDTIAELRSRARELAKPTGDFKLDAQNKDYRKQLLRDARDMERASPELAQVRGKRRALKRRLSNLNKAQVVLEERVAKKLEKIENSEELSLATLNRAARAGQKALVALSKVSDDKLDEVVERLRNTFAKTADMYDRGEERLARLIQGEEALITERQQAALPQPYDTTPTSVDELQPFTNPDVARIAGVPLEEAVVPPIAKREYPYHLATPKNQKDSERLITAVNKAHKEAKLIKLPINVLSTDQDVVGKSKVAKPGNETVFVEKIGNQYHIRDGNHRVSNAVLRGETEIEVRVADMDEAFGTGGLPTSEEALSSAAQQAARAERLTEVANRLGDAEGLDRNALRALINEGMQETLTKIQQITSRRAIRNAKLMEQARQIAPDTLSERIAKILGAQTARRLEVEDRLRVEGAEDVDLDRGTANFDAQAKADATRVMHKIQGTYLRLPVVEVAQGERGPVLARNLGFIPTERMKPWLEMDMEKLMRAHVRTLAPDVEIARKFGTIDLTEIIDPMVKEYDARVDALRTATDKGGKPLSQKAQEKAAQDLKADLERYKRNTEAVFKRLRHQWGVPANPDGAGYRLARTVQNLNVLRYMGNVTISSIPDLARPIMRHGLLRTFRDGWLPLVTNFKQFKATAQWLKHAGVGVDVTLNTRIAQMNDILDDLQRGSKFERGVEWATNRMGIVALFNFWTDTMKQMSGTIAHARLMDSIGSVMEGTGDVRAAQQYLAEVGIGGKEAAEIWEHARATGGVSKANGVWLPDTELWDAASPSYRNYMAAIAREVNNNIVTPGVERPLWTNATVTGQMISQFKSFAFSSTQKTLMAGLQQRDASFVVGTSISLALGALSYYIYATLAGDEAEQKMLNAGPDVWADEAIDRSGITAVFGPARDMLSRIPTTAPFATFSGGRTTRRGGDNLMDAIMGPSFDFATTAAEVVTGIDDPTLATQHSARKLLPYQNTSGPIPYLFQLRSLYDAVEDANPFNLPESRR